MFALLHSSNQAFLRVPFCSYQFSYFKFQVKTHMGLHKGIQKVEIMFLISMGPEQSQPYHHFKYYFVAIDNITECYTDEIHFYKANLCSASFKKVLEEYASKFQKEANYGNIYRLFLPVLGHKDNVFLKKFQNLKDKISSLASFNCTAQSIKSPSSFLNHFMQKLRLVSIYSYSLIIQVRQ